MNRTFHLAPSSLIYLLFFLIFLTACSAQPASQSVNSSPTPTDLLKTTTPVIPSPTSSATASPTLLPSPTATLPPTATPIPTPIVMASKGEVVAYTGPGLAYSIRYTLTQSETLTIQGRNENAGWWQVETPFGLAWVSAVSITALYVGPDIPIIAVAPPPTATPDPWAGFEMATVIDVVKGDTIDVLLDGVEYRVRYLLVSDAKDDEALIAQALAANRALVAGKTVYLEKDLSETDRLGRLLRYVYVDDLMVNEELLRLGLVSVTIYPPDEKYVSQFMALQADAQDLKEGIWHKPTPLPTATPPPQPVVAESAADPIQSETGDGPIIILTVNDQEEYVDLQNISDQPVDLNGWRLLSQKGDQNCNLGGILEASTTLRVWAVAKDADKGGFNCGFGRSIWNNSDSDPALLFNTAGEVVAQGD